MAEQLVASDVSQELCTEQNEEVAVLGLLPGFQTAGERVHRKRRPGEPIPERACRQCGTTFTPKRPRNYDRSRGLFCSRKCHNDSQRGKEPPCNATSTTPESTKAERVRANGLINMRIRRGHAKRPKACQMCQRPGRVDAHHPDYQQPDLVVFLCRSDHMKAHRDKAFEQKCAELARRLSPPPSPVAAPNGGEVRR